MDLEAIACLEADAWQKAAVAAADRMHMRSPPGEEGFLIIRLNAADAAIVQAALTLAGSALHAQMHRDATIGKGLVTVRPGSNTYRAPTAYEQAAAVLDKVARAVLPLVLRGIDLRSDALSGVLDDIPRPSTVTSSSELHVARYRGRAENGAGLDGAGAGVPAHVDQSVLTVIAADTAHGLEVEYEPKTQAVPVLPGQVAVLCGHTLGFATGGELRATRHRVVARQPRTVLAYKFKANVKGTIDLISALRDAGKSCSWMEHPMRVCTYSRLFHIDHDSVNADQPVPHVIDPHAKNLLFDTACSRPLEQGGAVRVVPVEALYDNATLAQMVQKKRAMREGRRDYGTAEQTYSGEISYEDVMLYLARRLTIFVKSLDGKTFTFNGLTALTSVRTVKVKIQYKTRISPDDAWLIYAGTPLEDEHALAYYAIEHESTFHLVLRLRGD